MDNLDKAVESLVAAAGPERGSVPETYEGLAAVLEEAERAAESSRNRALVRLAAVIAATDVTRASLVSLGCGALVESGGEPRLALSVILDRLPAVLTRAAAFAGVCRELAETPPEDLDINPEAEADPFVGGSYVDEYGAIVAEEMPAESQAWTALEPLCMGAIAMLSRSVPARREARGREELLTKARELGTIHRRVAHLATLFRILDGEELLVLHPELVRGYRVGIQGIGDNYQLHTLLADALIGDSAAGWLPGPRPDPRVVAAARDQLAARSVGTAVGFFHLLTWRALQADGTLRSALDNLACWIAGEGTPADIPLFENTRTVLLGPPPFPQTWDANRTFEGMKADLRVLEILNPENVRSWLDRIVQGRATATA
jgi:hypothetical protein